MTTVNMGFKGLKKDYLLISQTEVIFTCLQSCVLCLQDTALTQVEVSENWNDIILSVEGRWFYDALFVAH